MHFAELAHKKTWILKKYTYKRLMGAKIFLPSFVDVLLWQQKLKRKRKKILKKNETNSDSPKKIIGVNELIDF